MSKPATLHVHHAFLSISLRSLHNPVLVNGKSKAINYTISVRTQVRSPPRTSKNSRPSSNRAIWDNRKIVLKDVKSIFQQRFHGLCRCWIVRSLMMNENNKT